MLFIVHHGHACGRYFTHALAPHTHTHSLAQNTYAHYEYEHIRMQQTKYEIKDRVALVTAAPPSYTRMYHYFPAHLTTHPFCFYPQPPPPPPLAPPGMTQLPAPPTLKHLGNSLSSMTQAHIAQTLRYPGKNAIRPVCQLARQLAAQLSSPFLTTPNPLSLLALKQHIANKYAKQALEV